MIGPLAGPELGHEAGRQGDGPPLAALALPDPQDAVPGVEVAPFDHGYLGGPESGHCCEGDGTAHVVGCVLHESVQVALGDGGGGWSLLADAG